MGWMACKCNFQFPLHYETEEAKLKMEPSSYYFHRFWHSITSADDVTCLLQIQLNSIFIKSVLDNTFLISMDWKSVKVYLYWNIKL